MQKVYLLLRNNKQTGPHSLEELLQLNLKPLDLIWVEGKSQGWSFPAEVDSLRPYMSAEPKGNIQPEPKPASVTPPVSGQKKIFVSMPFKTTKIFISETSPLSEDPIEKKAGELRKRPEAPKEDVQKKYSRSIHKVEEDYTSWIYQKKEKPTSFSKNHFIAAIVLLTIIGGGVWAANMLTGKPKEVLVKQAIPQPIPEPGVITGNTQTSFGNLPVDDDGVKNKTKSAEKPQQNIKTGETLIKKNTPTIVVPDTNEKSPAINSAEKEVGDNTVPGQKDEVEPVSEQPKSKKGTFKDKVNDLFKRLTKKEEPKAQKPESQKSESEQPQEPVQEEHKPVENSNGERKSTRRGDEKTHVPSNLEEKIQIRMSESTGDWMMGVQGLKLTLYNRSNVTIKTAVVEVLYYTEQKTLLEKKTIRFFNVAAKKSQIVAAPDNRLADHADYKIISATGTENSFARF